jgi:putative peptidoglycan lipid II flippase
VSPETRADLPVGTPASARGTAAPPEDPQAAHTPQEDDVAAEQRAQEAPPTEAPPQEAPPHDAPPHDAPRQEAPRPKLPPVPPAAPRARPRPPASPAAGRRAAPLPPPPYHEAPPASAPSAAALTGRPEAPPAPGPAAGRPLPPPPRPVPPAARSALPPVAGPATPSLPAPAVSGAARPGRPLPPVPPPRRRFVPHPEDEFTQLIPVLPPVPRRTDETDEEAEEREGAPGASRGILRAAGTMAVATLVSRVTGLLRTMVLTAVLGVGLFNDAYNTANTLPNIVYELLLGGVLTSVVVPLLVHAQDRDPDRGTAYAQRLSTIAVTALAAVTVVAVLLAPLLTWAYGIRDDPGQVDLANWLARLLLVEIVFYGIGALATAILNSRDVFGPPAWAPVLNNVVVIVTGLLFAAVSGPGSLTPLRISAGGVWLLGIGTTLGIAVQALILLPLLRKAGVPLRPRWGLKNTGLREAGTLGLWVIGYVAVSQVGVLIATNIANTAGRSHGLGSAAFATTSLLFQMPYGIIGVALLTALLPRMSRAASRGDVPGVVSDLSLGTRLSALGLLPVTALLVVLGPAAATVLLARGETSLADARGMGTALAVGAFGLLPMAITLLQLRVFYAMKDARTPTLIQAGMVAVRVPLLFLVPALVDARHVLAGLMLVTSLTYVAGWVIGDVALRRALGTLRTRDTFLPLARIAAAAAAAAVVGWLVVALVGHVLGTSVAGSLGVLLVGTVVIGVTAVGGLVLARVPEVREPVAALTARLGRGRP